MPLKCEAPAATGATRDKLAAQSRVSHSPIASHSQSLNHNGLGARLTGGGA